MRCPYLGRHIVPSSGLIWHPRLLLFDQPSLALTGRENRGFDSSGRRRLPIPAVSITSGGKAMPQKPAAHSVDTKRVPGNHPDSGGRGGVPLEPQVRAELLATVARLIPLQLLMTPGGGLLLSFLVWRFNPPLRVGAWFTALCLVTLGRYLLIRAYRRAQPSPDQAGTWARLFVLGAFVAGCVWGMTGTVLLPPEGSPARVAVLISIVGITSIALHDLAPLRGAYAALTLPILLPFGVLVAVRPGAGDWLLGFCAMVYVAFVVAGARNVERQYAKSQRLRLEVLRLAAEREEANRAKSQFMAAMSHEIRTPLAGMLGLADLVLDRELGPDQRRRLSQLRRSGEHLVAIINDILDFSKIDSERLELEAVDFDLRSASGEVVELFRASAEAKGLVLRFDVATGVPAFVRGDPVRLRQVLGNLIGNAVKFTERGEVTARVGALSGSDESADSGATDLPSVQDLVVTFEVSDTGIGIPSEDCDRVFDAFAQADNSHARKYGGTGLGLSIARRLVALMGGDIGVESAPGKGSTFRFSVRLGVAESPPSSRGEPVSVEPTTQLRGRVLLAEDNAVNREVASAMLESVGLGVDTAEDGRQAVERAATQRFDVVLMDCQMPGMDGFEAARRIREHEEVSGDSARVPIIALTAYALSGDRDRCFASGMDDYLTKPFRREDLHSTLARWLSRKPGEAAPEPVASRGGSHAGASVDVSGLGSIDDAALVRLYEIDRGAGEMARRIINLYLATSPDEVAALRAAVARQECVKAAGHAHALKSASANVGATRLAEALRAVEQAARAGDLASLEAAAKEVASGHPGVCEALRAYATAA
jgi:signal transduction histidine kinase/CheY-like chemotaxis protein/HPt (histidine-containing phosphotransfer) domain-containing protein